MTPQELRILLQESAQRLSKETCRYRELLIASRLLHGKALLEKSIEMQGILDSWQQEREEHSKLSKLYSEALHDTRQQRTPGD